MVEAIDDIQVVALAYLSLAGASAGSCCGPCPLALQTSWALENNHECFYSIRGHNTGFSAFAADGDALILKKGVTIISPTSVGISSSFGTTLELLGDVISIDNAVSVGALGQTNNIHIANASRVKSLSYSGMLVYGVHHIQNDGTITTNLHASDFVFF